ncbi:hypothetical protein EGX54_25520 [Vibrio parahaemolyticus]|nr:hypothetical protein [Vibrio parahaemolyticus]EGR1475898.1 hypothetical protein [Vibrio parahaemolyticus]EGR1634920.1 hypothetical protein [Vibrio parahaemolyticus]EGR1640041.1 hypothetical protein [Vibrio parahaemolyticus]
MLHKVVGQTEKSRAKGPTGAINYLSGYRWRHTKPEVLRGNLEITRELLAHEDNDPYTHGVLSYEENALDVPQSEQDFAMNLIEETLMAGFPPEHYDIVWIKHTDKHYDPSRGSGRLELNYHIINRDLVTGKKITPYLAKYDQHRVGLAKQIINDKFNYASPDDPARARQINLEGYGSENKGAAKKLNDFVLDGIQKEEIDSRDDIIKSLQSRDDVEHVEPNKAETYLVVKMKGAKRNLRLKGTLYGKQFTSVERLLEATADDSRQYHRASQQRLADNTAELHRLNSQRHEKRKRLIEPMRKRGRKPKEPEPQRLEESGDLRRPENGQRERNHQTELEQSIQPNHPNRQGVGEDPNQKPEPHPEPLEPMGGTEPSPDHAEPVSRQMPINSVDSIDIGTPDRSDDWHTFTVLDIQKPKPKSSNNEQEPEHKADTNSPESQTSRVRETIEVEGEPNGRGTTPERPEHRGSVGNLQRAAERIKRATERIGELTQRIGAAIRGRFEPIQRVISRADRTSEIGQHYGELERQCHHLDQLLRGSDPIGLGLTKQLDNNIDLDDINPQPEPEPFEPAIVYQGDEATKALQAQVDAKQKADSKPASVPFERPKY